MEPKKKNRLIRLKHTFKKESSRDIVRQLIINTLLNYDSKKQTCYVSDIVKEIKGQKFFKGTTTTSIINSLISEELEKMSGSITFIKEHKGEHNNIIVLTTSMFYNSLNTMRYPNREQTRANIFTERFLSGE